MNRERWRGASLRLRLEALEKIFVAHPNLSRIIPLVNGRVSLLKAGGKAIGILVLAPPDGGKTTLAKYLLQSMPSSDVSETLDDGCEVTRTVTPCIYIQPPNPCSLGRIADAIVLALGTPVDGSERIFGRCRNAISQLKLAETLILIVDNAHDIPERRGHRGVMGISAFFRDIIDQARVIVLLLGTDIAEIVIAADPQLRKRIPAPMRLGFYDVGTVDGLATCLRMLQELDDELPLAEPSGLGHGQLGRAIACASDGKIGACASLIQAAMPHALAMGREHLELDDFVKAYSLIYVDYAAAINPFDEKFVPRRLNRPGEPHFQVEMEQALAKAKQKAGTK